MENFAISVCTHYPFHVQFSACISRFRLSAISFINKVPGRSRDADRGFDTLALSANAGGRTRRRRRFHFGTITLKGSRREDKELRYVNFRLALRRVPLQYFHSAYIYPAHHARTRVFHRTFGVPHMYRVRDHNNCVRGFQLSEMSCVSRFYGVRPNLHYDRYAIYMLVTVGMNNISYICV